MVTVTDAELCSSEGTIIIEGEFDLLTISTFTDCDEDNGTATATVTGGITTPAFAWSTGAAEAMITDLAPGFYSVTVTDTETDCAVHENVEVSQDPSCSVVISGTTFLNSINPECLSDTTTIPIPFIQISLSDGQIVYTDANGNYAVSYTHLTLPTTPYV